MSKALQGSDLRQHGPGLGFLLHAVDRSHWFGVQLVDGGTGADAVGADQSALEDGALRQVDVGIGVELRADVIDVGDELTTEYPHQVQKDVTVEVDPYQAAGDATLVA